MAKFVEIQAWTQTPDVGPQVLCFGRQFVSSKEGRLSCHFETYAEVVLPRDLSNQELVDMKDILDAIGQQLFKGIDSKYSDGEASHG